MNYDIIHAHVLKLWLIWLKGNVLMSSNHTTQKTKRHPHSSPIDVCLYSMSTYQLTSYKKLWINWDRYNQRFTINTQILQITKMAKYSLLVLVLKWQCLQLCKTWEST